MDDVDDDGTDGNVPPELERLIAGTLALMTAWYESPRAAICLRLMRNLAAIGRHEAVSDGMRRVCADAAARWAGYLEEADAAIDAGGATDDDDGEPVGASPHPGPGPITLH